MAGGAHRLGIEAPKRPWPGANRSLGRAGAMVQDAPSAAQLEPAQGRDLSPSSAQSRTESRAQMLRTVKSSPDAADSGRGYLDRLRSVHIMPQSDNRSAGQGPGQKRADSTPPHAPPEARGAGADSLPVTVRHQRPSPAPRARGASSRGTIVPLRSRLSGPIKVLNAAATPQRPPAGPRRPGILARAAQTGAPTESPSRRARVGGRRASHLGRW